MKQNEDKELSEELDYLKDHLEEVATEQQAARDRFLNDPANAETVKRIQSKMALAKLLYDTRTKAKLTQAEVARRMNVSQPVVARMERAKVDVRLSTLQSFFESCGAKLCLTPVWN